MQNQEKNNSFLPSWMFETEQYVPSIDKDGFITKSTQAVLGVLSKLKWKEGKDRCLSASPSLKLCYTFLYILLTACSKTTNTNTKTIEFNQSITDKNQELTNLVASCTSKGWTIENLTITTA